MHPARLGAFWFGIQAVWAALLGVVLQDRVTALSSHAVADFAWIAAAGAGFAALVQVLAGVLADRERARSGNRRAFYRMGLAIAVPGLVGVTAAPSLPWLWAAVLVLQLGMNVAIGPYQAIVSDYVEPERVGRASSWMSVQQFAGSVTGPLLATVLRGFELGLALSLCLAGGWWVTDATVARLEPQRAEHARLRLDANARTVLASRGLINLGFYTILGFLFFFVHESLGVADARTTTGVLILLFTISGVAGAALAGRPADRFDKRLVVSVSCVAIALAVGALAVSPAVPIALVCAALSGVAWGAFFTADWALAYAVLPREAMGAAMGVWNLGAAIPQIIAPAVTAPLVTALDARTMGLGPRAALLCVIVEFAAGTAWLWRLRPVNR